MNTDGKISENSYGSDNEISDSELFDAPAVVKISPERKKSVERVPTSLETLLPTSFVPTPSKKPKLDNYSETSSEQGTHLGVLKQ